VGGGGRDGFNSLIIAPRVLALIDL